MEIWAIYAVGASLLWSLVNMIDKYLVSKYTNEEHSSGALVLFSSLVGVFIAFFIGILNPEIWHIGTIDKFLLILVGFMSVAWILFYLYALEIEDVSVVVPWFLTIPAFGYIFGFLFLGESLTYYQQIGSLIIMLGLIVLSVDFKKEKISKFKTKVVLYMLAACIIIAAQGIIFKYVAEVESFWVSSFWGYLGLGFMGLILYIFSPNYRRDFIRMNREGGLKIFSLNFISELTTTAGDLLAKFALLLAPVTVVYLMSSFQPAFVLILTILGTLFLPSVVKESLNFRVLIPKVIAILITIIGSFVLFM